MRRTVSTGPPRLPCPGAGTSEIVPSVLVADPLEKLVEERHRERGVPVCGAVDDALRNQCRTARRNRLDADTKGCGDVSGAMRSWTERRHRNEVFALARCQPIEPYEKEVLVKLVTNSRRSAFDVIGRDRTLWRDIPDVVTPFLEEVWIPMR